LLSSADVYVSTSQHEGFGLMFLESMAVGLPIICFDRGGQTDFLVSGETGFIVRLNDETAFAEHIEMLRDNPELKKRQMAASLRKVNNYFIDRCAEKYEALFQQVLDTGTS
jgi:glycosyltransferase involved in cell wall biosynthesis